MNSLINLHGKTRDECAKALAQIPIVHVYGQLGERPYPQQGSQMYRPDQMEHPRYVETAAAGIRLYHEEAEAASTTAREVLSTAKRICFLGFSYNPFNVARLKVRSLDLSTTVIGTCRGLVGSPRDTVSGMRLGRSIAHVGNSVAPAPAALLAQVNHKFGGRTFHGDTR